MKRHWKRHDDQFIQTTHRWPNTTPPLEEHTNVVGTVVGDCVAAVICMSSRHGEKKCRDWMNTLKMVSEDSSFSAVVCC
jgi:hypothetical protein